MKPELATARRALMQRIAACEKRGQAAPECIRRHWFGDRTPGSPDRGISTLHGATVVIAFGGFAHVALGVEIGKLRRDQDDRGTKVWTIALPHPNARAVPKSTWSYYSRTALHEVMEQLALEK